MENLKKLTLLLFICLFLQAIGSANIIGYWQTVDKKTHKPTSVIAVYPYGGKYYGKVIASFNPQGIINDTMEQPVARTKGIKGNPYYCGMDIIWVAPPNAKGVAIGSVMDPRSGKVYNAKLWNENGNLILRGELMMFGRNEVLLPYQGNYKPNLSSLVPSS